MSGNLFIVSAPSGAGKTSLVRALLEADPQVRLSTSYTTRAPRTGEENGLHYHFVDETEFMRRLEQQDFLESAHVHGARYGTSRSQVQTALDDGHDLILEIDWQGAQQVKKLMPNAISIFILPPSVEELERRLNNRGQDSAEVIARRVQAAKSEIAHVKEFDYVTINDNFDVALHDISSIIRARRLCMATQALRYQTLIAHLTA